MMVITKEVRPKTRSRMTRELVTTDSTRDFAASATMSGSTPCAPVAKFHMSCSQCTAWVSSLRHSPTIRKFSKAWYQKRRFGAQDLCKLGLGESRQYRMRNLDRM